MSCTKPHIAYNTGENEWYTPPTYIEAARLVLGTIELDPASSDVAQHTVKANTYYTKAQDGLTKNWKGNVWMNPPFAAGLITAFVGKFIHHFKASDITSGIVLVNNATETRWFQELASVSSMVCYPSKRIRFLDPQGRPGSPLQGQALVYCGNEANRFASAFNRFGLILL